MDIGYVGKYLQEELQGNHQCFKFAFKFMEEFTQSFGFMTDSIDISDQAIGKHR